MAGLQQRIRLDDTPAHSLLTPCPPASAHARTRPRPHRSTRTPIEWLHRFAPPGPNRSPRSAQSRAARPRAARAGVERVGRGGDLLAVDMQEGFEGAGALRLVGGGGGALQLHARVGDPERLHEAHVDGARQRADEQIEHRPRYVQALEEVPARGARSQRLWDEMVMHGAHRTTGVLVQMTRRR